MSLLRLNVYRHDERSQALITLAGEIDLPTVPLASASLPECLYGGVRTIDAGPAAVTSCGTSGLNSFLRSSEQAAKTGRALRPHHPHPPPAPRRMLSLTDCDLLPSGLPTGPTVGAPAPRPTPLQAGAR